MENEIIEEVYLDDLNQSVDGVELVDSVEEIESSDTYSQDELVSALLSLMNERAAAEEEEVEDQEVFSQVEENLPVLVSLDNVVDYTDLLVSIDNRLSAVEDSIKESNSVQSLDTPLSEYSLSNVLLIGILAVSIIYIGYRFLKDNLLHL